MRFWIFFFVLAVVAPGCALSRTTLGGPDDASVVDTGGFDAGPPIDMGPRDVGTGDMGIDPPDGELPDTGPPDMGTMEDMGPIPCTDGMTQCNGAVIETCSGGTFSETTDCAAMGCILDVGGARCRRLVPANVGSTALVPTAAAWTVSGDRTFDTDMCTDATLTVRPVLQAGGPEVCLVSVSTFTVNSGRVLTVLGARPLVIVATGDVSIVGDIDVASDHDTERGAGSGTGGNDGAAATSSTFNSGGGGGGGLCTAGGAGGDGIDSAAGMSAGALGGVRITVPATLIPLVGGGDGGHGAGVGGTGGYGGGAIQISSATSLRLQGDIFAYGGGARGGDETGDYGAGGGGGSGGGILLEAPTMILSGTLELGGGGGGGGACPDGSGTAGGDGANGLTATAGTASRCAAMTAIGGTGARSAVVGVDGADGAAAETGNGGNGGGGGGGAGCFVVRNAAGTLPGGATIRGMSSSGPITTE